MSMMIHRRMKIAGASLAVALLASSAFAEPAAAPKESKVVVFAATSLQDAFAALSKGFEKAHPGTKVTFNFAGTQELRTQLEQGAAVDVFASADQTQMDALVTAGRASGPVVFARNEPVIVVAREATGKVRAIADLPSAKRIVVGVPEVPIGRYTVQILDKANAKLGAAFRSKVEARIVSRELNVRQVLAKVSLGEADAGIVYRTDARSAGDGVGIVAIPLDVNVIAEYPIALVTNAAHPTLARAWIDYVMSADGLKALAKAGFIAPTGGTKSE